MNQEEQNFIEEQQRNLESSQANNQALQTVQAQQMMGMQDENKSIVREQLDVTEELEMMEHLLRGEVLKRTEEGLIWVASNDNEMVILTEHGIHLIINTISFYINKNTLLSNYSEETINQKMEDFSCSLADAIFMEYEKVFKYPTEEELRAKLKDRIDKKTQRRGFAFELIGKKFDEQEVREGFLKEIEETAEKEMEKIKEQIIKNKLKRFEILIRSIQDAVHSTYLRALNGQERRTLRQHIHISESHGVSQPQQAQSKLNPMNYFGSNK